MDAAGLTCLDHPVVCMECKVSELSEIDVDEMCLPDADANPIDCALVNTVPIDTL